MEKLQAMAEEKGKSSFGFAYYLDTCKEERERGVTIQCNTKEFYTDKYHYTIVDAPGHKDYIKNMITGSATADVGLLLVPAEKGGFEAAIAKADAKLGVEEGQTRQHARLLYLLGVDQLIVYVPTCFCAAGIRSRVSMILLFGTIGVSLTHTRLDSLLF